MLDFGTRHMILSWDWEDNALQACPLCGMRHPVYVQGSVKLYGTDKFILHPEKGYSFCNCANIWYTDWKNIEYSRYNRKYKEKYEIKQFVVNSKFYVKTLISKFVNLKPKINSFLDIGCGFFYLLDRVKEQLGWDTYAVDINESLKTDKHTLIRGNVEDDEVFDKLPVVDVIWASHIFEHFNDPLKVAKKLLTKLTNGGILYIAMPDPYFIPFQRPDAWAHWCLHEHHIMWDMESFAEKLFNTGYVIKTLYHNINTLLTEFTVVGTKPLKQESDFMNLTLGKKGTLNVSINSVNPDDHAHKINNIDKEHREGVEVVKKLIKEGKKILPIAVNYYGHRLDGFKRYVAFKELGYKAIDVVVDKKARLGVQENMSWVVDG